MDHKLEYSPPKDDKEKGRGRDEPPIVKFMPKNARGHGDDGTTGVATGQCNYVPSSPLTVIHHPQRHCTSIQRISSFRMFSLL